MFRLSVIVRVAAFLSLCILAAPAAVRADEPAAVAAAFEASPRVIFFGFTGPLGFGAIVVAPDAPQQIDQIGDGDETAATWEDWALSSAIWCERAVWCERAIWCERGADK